jgi:hypothetical protein
MIKLGRYDFCLIHSPTLLIEHTTGYFNGYPGKLEQELRDILAKRDACSDKRQKQILTLQIRDLRDQLFYILPSTCSSGPINVSYPNGEAGLFLIEIGRIESSIREATKRMNARAHDLPRNRLPAK